MSARDLLMEAATTVWRPRSVAGTIRSHPAWADLDPTGQEEAYGLTHLSRRLEAALPACDCARFSPYLQSSDDRELVRSGRQE